MWLLVVNPPPEKNCRELNETKLKLVETNYKISGRMKKARVYKPEKNVGRLQKKKMFQKNMLQMAEPRIFQAILVQFLLHFSFWSILNFSRRQFATNLNALPKNKKKQANHEIFGFVGLLRIGQCGTPSKCPIFMARTQPNPQPPI